jgi:predicted RNase H-like HicB family nuclease
MGKKKRQFTLDYWRDGEWLVGRIREIPGVFSQGKTMEELTANIIDAYRMMRQEHNSIVPVKQYKTRELGIAI